MAVRTEAIYEGDLHCRVTHGPSGDTIPTDAPRDNEGRGEHFSPTDLVAAAMGSCALTIMGIAARKRDLDIRGARAVVVKEMGSTPRRHIARIALDITLPSHLDARSRTLLERAARGCPVQASLSADTKVDMTFRYEGETEIG